MMTKSFKRENLKHNIYSMDYRVKTMKGMKSLNNLKKLHLKFLYAKKVYYLLNVLKALVVKNSVLHHFGFGKVSPAKQLQLHQEGFVNPRHFSKTEVVQNTVLNH